MRLRVAAALALGLITFGSLASARPASRAHTAVAEATFNLVNAVCTTGQVQIGRGCWDGKADQSKWQVHDGTATETYPTYNGTFTWKVPGQIPPSGGDVSMAVRANDVSNNSGLDARICVLQGFNKFQTKQGGDVCAEAFAMTAGSSQSDAKDAIMLPGSAPVNADCPGGGFGCVTLEISLGDGGNVFYTYRASASKRVHVNYTFLGIYNDRPSGLVTSLRISARGKFDFPGPPGKHKIVGEHQTGSAVIELRFRGTPHRLRTAHLEATHVSFFPSNQVTVTYAVTQSDMFCLKVGRTYRIDPIELHKSDLILFDFCSAARKSFKDKSEVVSIKSS